MSGDQLPDMSHVAPSTTFLPASAFHRAAPNLCPVCGQEQRAGYVRCPRPECRPTKEAVHGSQ